MIELRIDEILIWLRNYLRKYFWFFVFVFFISLIVGLVEARKFFKVYYYKIYARTGLLNTSSANYDYGAVFNDLKLLHKKIFASEDPQQQISYYLNLPFYVLIDFKVDIARKTFGSQPAIELVVNVVDTAYLQLIKDGFVYYFENFSPLRKLYNRQKVYLQDSLQVLISSIEKIASNLENKSVIFDVSSLYNKNLLLFNYSYPLFYYISDFVPVEQEISYLWIIVKYPLMGIILAFFITLLIEFVALIRKFLGV